MSCVYFFSNVSCVYFFSNVSCVYFFSNASCVYFLSNVMCGILTGFSFFGEFVAHEYLSSAVCINYI